MRDSIVSSVARFLGISTLAVTFVCATLPAPPALAEPGMQLLLAQAYPPSAAPPAPPPPPSPPASNAPAVASSPAMPPPAAYPEALPPPPVYLPPTPPPQGYPSYTPPQISAEQTQAVTDGKADADADLSAVLWFGAGFLLTWGGILLGYLLPPTPDGVHLIGRSPTYISAYTAAYQSEGKSFQGIHAVYGCVTAGVIEVVLIVGIVILDASLASTTAAAGG
jgi:hypothetical protein